jgi:integrase
MAVDTAMAPTKYPRSATWDPREGQYIFKTGFSSLVNIVKPQWVEEELSRDPSATFWQVFFRKHETKTGQEVRDVIPNISQKGNRLGNWLTREQAKDLLTVPDRSTLKGKRDYVILALLVGCALRRNELAELAVETIQQREGRWVLVDLEGKGRRSCCSRPCAIG